jgi:hypothetical protein
VIAGAGQWKSTHQISGPLIQTFRQNGIVRAKFAAERLVQNAESSLPQQCPEQSVPGIDIIKRIVGMAGEIKVHYRQTGGQSNCEEVIKDVPGSCRKNIQSDWRHKCCNIDDESE